jgi:protein-tyrosine kinase
MDSISQALQRARTGQLPVTANSRGTSLNSSYRPASEKSHVTLSHDWLQSNCITAFDSVTPQTRHYDLLRNQIATHKRKGATHVVAVTAPTQGCGVTTTAINLAFSFARTRDDVWLMDANSRSPLVSARLGIPKADRMADADDAWLRKTAVQVRNVDLTVVSPFERGSAATERDTSRRSSGIDRIERLLRESDASVVVIDVPPMLTSDETLPLVLDADSVVLVLATGQSKLSDLNACKSFLNAGSNLQVVLNKGGEHGL